MGRLKVRISRCLVHLCNETCRDTSAAVFTVSGENREVKRGSGERREADSLLTHILLKHVITDKRGYALYPDRFSIKTHHRPVCVYSQVSSRNQNKRTRSKGCDVMSSMKILCRKYPKTITPPAPRRFGGTLRLRPLMQAQVDTSILAEDLFASRGL